MKPAISVSHLVKRYKKAKENAVDDISFSVKAGRRRKNYDHLHSHHLAFSYFRTSYSPAYSLMSDQYKSHVSQLAGVLGLTWPDMLKPVSSGKTGIFKCCAPSSPDKFINNFSLLYGTTGYRHSPFCFP